MSRLSIEIDPEQHRQIKTLATYSGMTIKEYILSKTLPSHHSTEEHVAYAPNSKRLKKAIKTPSDQHVGFETIEDLKNALGI